MRKDLKIGLAIGAVLLVVLIVYLAVPKHDNQVAQGPTGTSADNPAADDTSTPKGSAETPAPEEPSRANTGTEPSTGTPTADGAGKKGDIFDKETRAADAAASTEKPAGQEAWAQWLDHGDFQVKTTVTPTLSAVEKVKPKAASSDAETPKKQKEIAEPATPSDPTVGSADVAKPAAETPAAKPDAAGARTHTVRSGESYARIAKAIYGDERYYLEIEKANPGIEPEKLKVGTVIKLPDIAAAKPAASSAAAEKPAAGDSSRESKAIDDATEYRVQSGDNLHRIATRKYGSSTMAEKIYELNKDKIGSDPAKLKVGTVLKMPPNPNNESGSR